MHHLRRACALIVVAVVCQFSSSCSAADVIEIGHVAGVDIPIESAQLIAVRHHQSIESMIRERWAGTGQADRAVRIARCESGLQADPPHNNPHYGAFQMGFAEFRKFGDGDIFNARDNIDAAFNYWQVAGWRPWACRG